MPKLHENKNIPVDKLVPFPNHTFKPYEGRKFEALVNSIRESGLLVPIIVRPKDGKYEILSGHNRTTAARAAGLYEVPAVIRNDLTEEEAQIIVTVTNLIQRSFADLSHSERAAALTAHYNAIKSQGKRTDILESIGVILGEPNEDGTYANDYHKLKARDVIAKTYGISGASVGLYIRVSQLTDALKERLDDGQMSLRAAVELSYLSPDAQNLTNEILEETKRRIEVGTAKELRAAEVDGELGEDTARSILTASGGTARSQAKPVKVDAGVIAKYFDAGQSESDVSDTIAKALEAWFAREGDA